MFIEGGQEEKRLLIEALSRYNYFPNQRLGLSEPGIQIISATLMDE
ncbi:hypothetical protein [Aeromonas allosaccharophila]|nr:hypothetical protein [Aeromonas allosaccharophila]